MPSQRVLGFLVGLIKKREEGLPLFIVVEVWEFSGEREGGGGGLKQNVVEF